jgi:hypothetical protein
LARASNSDDDFSHNLQGIDFPILVHYAYWGLTSRASPIVYTSRYHLI